MGTMMFRQPIPGYVAKKIRKQNDDFIIQVPEREVPIEVRELTQYKVKVGVRRGKNTLHLDCNEVELKVHALSDRAAIEFAAKRYRFVFELNTSIELVCSISEMAGVVVPA